MAKIKVSVINESTVLKDHDVQPVVNALQVQVTRDFAPHWGIDADVVYVPAGHKPDPTTWWLVLLDNSDQQGALGYHDLTPTGLPMGKVFIKTDLQYKLAWSVTMSHELLEMIADPDIDLTVFSQTSDTAGYLYAFEMCDAVEDDSFGYAIGSVKVSNFVLPAYFQPGIPGNKWDFMGKLPGPVPAMLTGGYLSQFPVNQPGSTSGWTQINAELVNEATHSRTKGSGGGTRKVKRANKATIQKSSDTLL